MPKTYQLIGVCVQYRGIISHNLKEVIPLSTLKFHQHAKCYAVESGNKVEALIQSGF